MPLIPNIFRLGFLLWTCPGVQNSQQHGKECGLPNARLPAAEELAGMDALHFSHECETTQA
jgi:hypothetical protein